MEGKLDKLFKDKLAQHKVNPSDRAWDQINHHLANKRKSVWTTRFAVAASLLVLISAISVGYFYINKMNSAAPALSQSKKIENPEIKTESEDEIKSPLSNRSKSSDIAIQQPPQAAEKQKNETAEYINEKSTEPTDKAETTQNKEKAPELVEEDLIIPVKLDPEIADSQEFIADLISIEDIKPVEQEQQLDSNKEPDSIEEAAPEKTYPKIRIVYKADDNSDLVASNSKTLIDKGIKKLTQFSDEHIITDQVKTKLRNTKDELLALNFGKIINKSNKQIDN